MISVWGLISITAIIISSGFLSRLFRPARLIEYPVLLFLFTTGQLILTGFILSRLNLLAGPVYWAAGGGVVLVLEGAAIALFPSLRAPARRKTRAAHFFSDTRPWFAGLPRFEKFIISLLLVTIIAVNIINLAVVFSTAPHIWDNMVTRLSRTAYYIQHGNMGYYDANMYSQVLFQKNGEILFLYMMVISGRGDNPVLLVQFFSYWMVILLVYGISRELKLKKSAALFAALIFGLLTQVILQATTANNDLLITAYIGSLVAGRR